MSESQLKKQMVDAIKARFPRINVIWRHGAGPYAPAGLPDIFGVLPPRGRLLVIEAKLPGEKPTKLQADWLRRFAEAGACAIVAHSADEAVGRILAYQNYVKEQYA
jgi:hypothetical protein